MFTPGPILSSFVTQTEGKIVGWMTSQIWRDNSKAQTNWGLNGRRCGSQCGVAKRRLMPRLGASPQRPQLEAWEEQLVV